MSSFKLAIATCTEWPDLIPSEQYLLSQLPELGIKVEPAVWNDPNVNWAEFNGVLIRTVWDYHKHIVAFRSWIDQLEQLDLIVGNPTAVLRWNAHKNYLEELGLKGITIPPTLFLPQGSDLGEIQIPWSVFIIKPAVSATAFQTFKLTNATYEAHRSILGTIIQEKDLLVQQFIPSISEQGEYSLMFFDKKFSHAVLKKAKAGEYRVQEEFGGNYSVVEPDEAIVRFASEVLATVADPCLYARVDLVLYKGQPMLMELELIEPELFLLSDDIRKRLVTSITSYFL
ncbi:MAG: hypothetical protein RIF33_16285 [Cyclobacteriaceae bacterium]